MFTSHFVRISVGILAFVIANSGVYATNPLKFQYQSPTNGSMYNSPQTTILIKPGMALKPTSVTNTIFLVVGSFSGVHAGKATLASDKMTVSFKPTYAFANSERVTVQIRAGLMTSTGQVLGTTAFSFVISSYMGKRSVLAEAMPALRDTNEQSSTGGLATAGYDPSTLIAIPPDSIGALLSIAVNNDPTPGAIFFSSFQSTSFQQIVNDYLVILNNDGSQLFSRTMPAPCLDFKVQPTGVLTYYDSQRGYFIALDSQYNVVDSFMCGDGYSTDTHDCELLPNHHALVFAPDTELVNMQDYITGGSPQTLVIGLVLQEIDSDKNVVFQWRSWDNHYNILDAVHQNMLVSPIDYVHANSIEMDTDGNLILSARHLDEVTKINRSDGSMMWRLGGVHNQFTFVNDTFAVGAGSYGFSHQHCVRRIANGDITMFDNGNYHTPGLSRAVEYRVDPDAKTCTLVWQYQDRPEAYSGAMGSVERLDNGNTLIGYGLTSNPAIIEVRPDGTKAWELDFSPPSISYRAFRFPWNPATASIHTASTATSFGLSGNYPNPFGPGVSGASWTNVNYTLAESGLVTLSVYDITGREVSRVVNSIQAPGTHHAIINAAGLASGSYTVRLVSGSHSDSRTILFVR
jgi:hypothetical protein